MGWVNPEQSGGSRATADRAVCNTKAATSRCHQELSQLQEKLPLAYRDKPQPLPCSSKSCGWAGAGHRSWQRCSQCGR